MRWMHKSGILEMWTEDKIWDMVQNIFKMFISPHIELVGVYSGIIFLGWQSSDISGIKMYICFGQAICVL